MTTETVAAQHSLLAAKPLGEAITEAYDLGGPVACDLRQPGLNDTYLVTAKTGRFVARVYRASGPSIEEISWELELLKHLADRGVPVSVPVATIDGDFLRSLEAPEGPRYLALFTYASGRPLNWSQEHESRAAGRLAAQLHAAADDFILEPDRPTHDLAYLIDASRDALLPYLRTSSADVGWLEAFRVRLHGWVSELLESGLDWGICHGDFGASNIHVGAGGQLTVFDFDLSARGWRACDFVAAWAVAAHEEKQEIWESFLAGYLERRRLSEVDQAAVPLFYGINRLWSIGVHARNVPYRGCWRLEEPRLDASLHALRAWEDDYTSRGNR